jgi:transcriptional regulator with XRE-family HTH domain
MPRTFRDADASIGARLRLRRKELGLSQEAIGEQIGVSYQQVQKYEVAKNRMSAGLLYEVSKLLGVPITYFFEDCEDGSEKGRKRKATKSLRPDQLNAENDG